MKLVDPYGEMLEQSWEKYATKLAQAEYVLTLSTGFLSKHFCLQPFFHKDSIYLLFSSVSWWGSAIVYTEGKTFEI